jgi:hypothetical protein
MHGQLVLAGGAVGPLLARVARRKSDIGTLPPRSETERFLPVAPCGCFHSVFHMVRVLVSFLVFNVRVQLLNYFSVSFHL